MEIKDLDIVLTALCEKKEYVSLSFIEELLPHLGQARNSTEVSLVLDKLITDGYVGETSGNTSVLLLPKYYATFNGLLFQRQGGYELLHSRIEQRNKDEQEAFRDQHELNKRLKTATKTQTIFIVVAAFAAVASAIFSLLEYDLHSKDYNYNHPKDNTYKSDTLKR